MKGDIRYVRSAGAAIAFQVLGDGPINLVFVLDYMSNLVYGLGPPVPREWNQYASGEPQPKVCG